MAMPLPPLKTLMTFTLVAQTLSFSKAAALLNLTQSAISKQIQQLEAQLGCTLFERAGGKSSCLKRGDTIYRLWLRHWKICNMPPRRSCRLPMLNLRWRYVCRPRSPVCG